MRYRPIATSITVLLLLINMRSLAAAQTNYATARLERRMVAARAAGPIVIDGVLDEEAWRDAQVASHFIQSDPHEGVAATFDTEVRVLYDDENLYVGVFNRDDEPTRAIVGELKKDFNVDKSDVFGLVLDTFHDQRNGYEFQVNPSGAKWDAQCFNDSREVNENWDGVWFVKTRLADGGWYAELAIPWRSLKFPTASSQTWGVNFVRRVRRKNEDSYWSPVPRFERIHRVSLAGTLEGLTGLQPGNNLRFKPYAAASASKVASSPTSGSSDFGIDAKYGVTTGLTWDFTVNTDFSQVEADQQQINLSRFSLFFPEKRDFFLENSGIFQFGGDPQRLRSIRGGARQIKPRADPVMFFSRRIGLSDSGEALPVLGGTRLTGKASGFAVGALNIQQRAEGSTPSTNFTALRVRHPLTKRADIGLMVLNKAEAGARVNSTLGADANFRLFGNLAATGYVAKTFSPVVAVPGTGSDVATFVKADYRSNFWEVNAAHLTIGDRFNDELGFVPIVGMAKFEGEVGIHLRPKDIRRWVRDIYPHFQLVNVSHSDGRLNYRQVDWHVPFNFQDGSYLETGINPSVEYLTAPFVVNRTRNIIIAPGRYEFNEAFVLFFTNDSAVFSVNGRYGSGSFYNGHKHAYDLGVATRPNEHFNGSVTFSRNDVTLPAGAFQTNLVAGRLDVGVTTKVFLNALLQYNTDARQWSSNVRFNVIHRPLSDFFIVYNEQRDSESHALINRAVIAKMTYMVQF